jgi:integrase/recombinase XerD
MKMERKKYLAAWMPDFLNVELKLNQCVSTNTRRSYRDTLKKLTAFLTAREKTGLHKLTVEMLGVEPIREFLDSLESNGCSPSTRNQRLAALKSFFRYIGRSCPEYQHLSLDVMWIKNKRFQQCEMDYLDKEEGDCLLSIPDCRTPLGYRNYVLLRFLYETGARASEAAAVLVTDVYFDPYPYVVLHGKGNKVRECAIGKELAFALKELTASARKPTAPVFCGIRGSVKPITRSGIYLIVTEAFEKCKEKMPSLASKNITPHSLRHSMAMQMLDAGLDINYIQGVLGHASSKTTNRYASLSLEGKRRGLEKCSFSQVGEKQEWPDNGKDPFAVE